MQLLCGVLPNETKYAIAREYGISVADIDANPVVAVN
jgi:hypothetical protein